MNTQMGEDVWTRWLSLWNGDLAVADTLIAPQFVAHFAAAGASPQAINGPDAMKQWIGGSLAAFTNPRFVTEVGPLIDGDLIAGRWMFRGTYAGGIPGASSAAIGTEVVYAGMDMLRIKEGQIVEYWLCADIMSMLQQVGVIPS
jgi:predicted ester cyclase